MKIKDYGQLLTTLIIVFFALNSSAETNNSSYQPIYKVDRCDCFGFSDDIPTFLSDIIKGDLHISGKGNTLAEAQDEAQRMCIETYRNIASSSQQEDPSNVIYSDCTKMQSTPEGDWVTI